MRRFSIVLAVAVLMAAVPVLAAEGAAERPRNVILFGWDAAQRNHVNECLERGQLPTLKKLAAEGKMVDIDITDVTDTKAGWAQILTGYGPEITGVYSNGKYQPIPQGYTIFERLRAHFGADKIATVAVIGKKKHVGGISAPVKRRLDEEKKPAKKKQPRKKKAAPPPAEEQAGQDQPKAARKKRAARAEKRQPGQPGAGRQPGGKIVVEDGVKYRVIPGAPYHHTHTNVDVWRFGLMQDQKIGTTALEMLDRYKDKPFFFFVHFADIDHKGHKHGENSQPYNDAIISADKWTGRIIERLRELKLYDKTLVYISVDHGFDEGKKSHKKAPYVFMATNDKGVVRGGYRVDIPVTIMERMGLDLAKIDPPLTGSSLTKPAASGPAKSVATGAKRKAAAKAGPKGKRKAKAAQPG